MPRLFIISGNPSVAEGLVLRRYNSNDTRERATSGKERPGLQLEIQNAGRSPAIAVEIGVDLSAPMLVKPGMVIPDFEPDPDHTEGLVTSGTKRGSGTIALEAIAAGGTASILIENDVGLQVTITPRQFGRQIKWHTKHQPIAPIAVVTPDASFRLEANYG